MAEGRSRLLTGTASAGAIGVGLVVLFGWFADIPVLKSVLPGLSTMKANTATAFILTGAALAALRSRLPVFVSRGFAMGTGLLAGLTLLQYVSGQSFGIDQLLVADRAPVPATAPPGRPGANTSLAFLLLAMAILLTGSARPFLRHIAQALALLGVSIAAVGVVGYAYSVELSYGILSYTQMAVHTAVMLLVLGIGVASVRSDEGIIGVVTGPGPGGILTRRLLPAIVLGPFVAGWILILGRRAELYGTELGVAIFVLATIALTGCTMFLSADRVDRFDSARREIEREVLEGNERLRFALAAARMGVWDLDSASGRMRWSESMAQVFGLAADQAPRTLAAFLDLIHADDRADVRTALDRAIASEGDYAVEFRTIWPDGTTHWVYGRAKASFDPDGKLVRLLGVGLDVTDRKTLEHQLLQTQKLEAVGQLTGGLAHDLNNRLAAIVTNLELLEDQAGENAEARSLIASALRSAERGTELTSRLLVFSRSHKLQPKPLDVNRTIREMTELLRRTLGEFIAVETVAANGLWWVNADPGQLENAVLNLALNARDAMPNGGKLTLETANVELDRDQADRHAGLRAGRYVMLAVTDTGHGMTPEVLARAFEPFFTTKATSEGSGLGLSMVYGFVKGSEGHAKISSEPNRGTAVKIYLPRTEQPEIAEPAPAALQGTRKGTESLLVVEDDDEVRDTIEKLLKCLGYRVLVAADGQAALDVLGRPEPVDLLLTDVGLGRGMNGVELAQRARRRAPGLKVAFMSGYTQGAFRDIGHLEEAGIQLLSKPFRRSELERTIRRMLDSDGTPGA